MRMSHSQVGQVSAVMSTVKNIKVNDLYASRVELTDAETERVIGTIVFDDREGEYFFEPSTSGFVETTGLDVQDRR